MIGEGMESICSSSPILYSRRVMQALRLCHLRDGKRNMARDAKVYAFYKTRMWRRVSKEYIKQVGGLCERCYQQGKIVSGEIVHHKVHVTAETIDDSSITLNPDNLELVCRQCHAKEHPEMYGHDERRYKIEDGQLILTGE